MSREINMTEGYIRREDFMPLEEDAHGAWMSSEGKVAAFLSWFTDDPVAEAPLKLVIMLSSSKNPLRLVSKDFKSHAEEGTTKIKWTGPDDEEEAFKPSSLMLIIASPIRNRYGCFKDCLPNLKSIDCDHLDTLMDLNGCPSGLEELNCFGCPSIRSLAPLDACTNLRKLDVSLTNVSSLKPLMGSGKLEWLDISSTPVTDLSPLSTCIDLKVLWMSATQVSDLSPLSGLHQLRSVDIESTKVTNLTPLNTLFHLSTLLCNQTWVTDLSPLSKCPELKALDIWGTEVKSLAPLLQCKKLQFLHHNKSLENYTKQQAEGYMRSIQELLPDLVCSEDFDHDGSLSWLPTALRCFWDNY